MWENHLFREFTLINVSLCFSALGLHLSDVCERVTRRIQVWLSVILSGSTGWFSSTHSGSKSSPEVTPEHLCSEPIRGPPGLATPHKALWIPDNSGSVDSSGIWELVYNKPHVILTREARKALILCIGRSSLREKARNVVCPIPWALGISHEYWQFL